MMKQALWTALMALGVFGAASAARGDVVQLQRNFQTPPDDARIMVRWWWFGPAVDRAGIDRELAAMKAGGIGGFEVQPTYPLVLDNAGANPPVKNIRWMSPEFLEMLGYTAAKAREMGMRFDLTLGSGWPYGGPKFDQQTEGPKRLNVQTVPVAAGQTRVAANGRNGVVFAAFAGPVGGDLSAMKEVPLENGAAQLPAGFAGGQVIFFGYGPAGLTAVKRAAYGADGPIIDHLSAKVVDRFIELVGEPEVKACGSNPPFSIFCDSLEVQGENWTEDFLGEFQKRRGYDLRPLLPALAGDIGERTADVRHDFGQTVTDLFNENFNAKFTALAKKYGTRFRIQGYGYPPAGLFSFGFADLPEGEGGGNGNWRSFRATRYAASASHLLGQKLASSETFTWLHQASFRAVPLDIKGEVDTHFLEGINQIDGHGWPYTPNGLAYPGGSFYAAAVFDEKNPWYVAMPEIAGYMQRVSQMMREGTPANDVALYANDSDIWAGAGPSFSSLNEAYTGQSQVLDGVLAAGYNLDLWDDGMLAQRGKVEGGKLVFGEVQYPVVVLNGPVNMPLATARKLEEFARGGGILVSVGARVSPTRVPGYKTTGAQQQELQAIMGRVFGAGGPGIVAPTPEQFAALVGRKLVPDAVMSPANAAMGVVHRHADGGEAYFVANTGVQKQRVKATFRQTGMQAELWDPLTGAVRPLAVAAKDEKTTTVALELEPLGSTLVVFTKRELPATAAAVKPATLDLSAGWAVSFAAGPGGEGKPVAMDKLASWTDVPGMQNYSGVASYEKKITVSADVARAAMVLSLGEATGGGGGGGGRGGNGYVAALNSPVRDAAVVFVNGKRAGAAWCPPYAVEVTGLLKEGENTIRIEVGNTAVNYLAKAGFPNYNLAGLRQAYGNRFDPQNTNLLVQPLPSGLLGPIRLEPAK
jgi:hypothetical protein